MKLRLQYWTFSTLLLLAVQVDAQSEFNYRFRHFGPTARASFEPEQWLKAQYHREVGLVPMASANEPWGKHITYQLTLEGMEI